MVRACVGRSHREGDCPRIHSEQNTTRCLLQLKVRKVRVISTCEKQKLTLRAAVLVSGASGYVASWVCLQLLEKGYSVRGTARTAAKGQWMKEMYAQRGLDNFECVVVEDLENVSISPVRSLVWKYSPCFAYNQDNAFDEAIKGVE